MKKIKLLLSRLGLRLYLWGQGINYAQHVKRIIDHDGMGGFNCRHNPIFLPRSDKNPPVGVRNLVLLDKAKLHLNETEISEFKTLLEIESKASHNYGGDFYMTKEQWEKLNNYRHFLRNI